MQNPGIWICGLLCGVPAIVSLIVALLFRSLARRRITMNVERSSIALPELQPGFNRLAVYFDLEERKPSVTDQSKGEDE